jgi:hypothetical protein
MFKDDRFTERQVMSAEAHFEPTVYVNKQIKKIWTSSTNGIYTLTRRGIFLGATPFSVANGTTLTVTSE